MKFVEEFDKMKRNICRTRLFLGIEHIINISVRSDSDSRPRPAFSFGAVLTQKRRMHRYTSFGPSLPPSQGNKVDAVL